MMKGERYFIDRGRERREGKIFDRLTNQPITKKVYESRKLHPRFHSVYSNDAVNDVVLLCFCLRATPSSFAVPCSTVQ